MSAQPSITPVQDSVPKVSGNIAVGEDLDFQRKWWRFEHAIWIFFVAVLVCDVLGLFGRGWLAKETRATPDKTLTLDYERIERAGTPSTMMLSFGPAAISHGHIQVFVSDSIVKPLGAQRISPEPTVSSIGNGGILYTFDASQSPAMVQIALEPSFPGLHRFHVQVPGSEPIDGSIYVVP